MDPASLTIIAMFTVLIIWETLFPGRALPKAPGWKARGVLAFTVFFYLSSYLPLLWTKHLLPLQLLDLTRLGTVAGTLIGLLVYEVFVWIWHWSMHQFDLLWRTLHQMHHSAERLDTFGALYFSPLDMVGWTALASLALTLVVGITPQAATNILLITMFASFFQHANIRTPRWLGYILQRPESHTIHHGRGVHRYNYADLPVVDMLFGTFRNPRIFELPTGFYEGASSRVLEMLIFKDVSRPLTAKPRRPATRKPAAARV